MEAPSGEYCGLSVWLLQPLVFAHELSCSVHTSRRFLLDNFILFFC